MEVDLIYKNSFLKMLITILFFSNMISAGEIKNMGKIFTGSDNIGRITNSGSYEYDVESKEYRITGSGDNIWANNDAFYFLWYEYDGDQKLQTDINWIGEGQHLHRKAGLMFRTGLEKDDPYVDAVVHGDGLISMQYRKIKGGLTYELKSPISAPATITLEKSGNEYSLSLKKDGRIFNVGTITVELNGSLYTGLVVCSHDSNTFETAVFSNLSVEQQPPLSYDERTLESTLEILDIENGAREIIYRDKMHFEAPNWSYDGKFLLINSRGSLYKLHFSDKKMEKVNTGFADNCNNDHGISPNGKELVISHHPEDGKSRIYILPIEGGEPRLITPNGPSYWHGWSPDGKILAYCAERNDQYDIYTIGVNGGEEKQLTDVPGLDDGPEYSPDGKYIYFNSVRSGQMKIWRMNSDGSDQIQITPDDEYGDWFAHPSPDGKWIVFVSYDRTVEGHPANKNVFIRKMSIEGGEPEIIATLFGGQGTMNVPSWSADSKRFAFVSYRLVSP